MPSVVIGQPVASGPQCIISGTLWSGHPWPIGGILFKWDWQASGAIYLGWSGGMTLTSGGMQLSGGILSGLLDGVPLARGESLFVPRSIFQQNQSGTYNVFARHDAAVSGVHRLWFEAF